MAHKAAHTASAALDSLFTHLGQPAPFAALTHIRSKVDAFSLPAILEASKDPRDAPLLLTLAIIPTAWVLGHISGNVSWIDRIWTTFPLVTTALIVGWTWIHGEAFNYAASLPRLILLFILQIVWSVRLTKHTARRGLYHLNSEDYRYVVIRKLMPKFAFELIHIFAVVIMQPMLLYALCVPIALLVRPSPSLWAGPVPEYAIRFGAFPLLAKHFPHIDARTPVLHAYDALFALMTLGAVAVEGMADNAMYAFQTAKHALMDKQQQQQKPSRAPVPVQVPPAYYPGFPIRGLHAWSRHPNFASEQAFWLSQAFFAVNASKDANLEQALGPAFGVSLLFCASTALTEWITSRKYPVYRAYSRLVGQFLPQETALKWTWTAVTGAWPRLEAEVYKRGSELYRQALEEGSILAPADDDLSASNLRVGDRVIQGVPRSSEEKKTQ